MAPAASLSDRLPPQNIEAEQAVLGSLLIDPEAVHRVAPNLRPADFYRETHGLIYAAILDLHERRQPADIVTLCDELEKRQQLETVGGAPYLTSLINVVPTSVHAEHYAGIVSRTAIQRRLIGAAGEIAGLAYEPADDIGEVIDRAEQELFKVSQQRASRALVPVKEVIASYIARLEELSLRKGQPIGIPTGFDKLDLLLGGLQPSDLVILAARPSMGKSALALSIALQAARRWDSHIAIFSLEMSAEQLVQRLLSSETGIDSQKLRLGRLDGDEWDAVAHAAGRLGELVIFIDDSASLSAMEMRTKARRVHAEHRLDLIVLDYLQLMRGDARAENRVQEISYISRALKGLARELHLPILALSQLSRAVESRDIKQPQLSDLRDSGSIEQDADVVMFIYRDVMYFPTEEDWAKKYPGKPYRPNIAEISVAKQRNGPSGRKVELGFIQDRVQFVNLVPERVALNE